MAQDNNSKKVVLERQYNVPLRRAWSLVPEYKRAKKAISAMKAFIEKHMKSKAVKLDSGVNLAIWKRGMKSPPHHLKIVAKKFDDDSVYVTYADSNLKVNSQIKKAELKANPSDEKPAKKTVKKKAVKKTVKKAESKTEKASEKKDDASEKPKVAKKEKEVSEDKAE